MRILNLYSGIGGNRKKWGDKHQITAVEINPKIAQIYEDHFPNDEIIIADAHQFLLEHYSEYDFIWSSPPCPSHSMTNTFLNAQGIIRYPDMNLYQEILLLKHFHKGFHCVENVKSYYTPLIPPQVGGRHFFWANFRIPKGLQSEVIGKMGQLVSGRRGERTLSAHGFDLSKYSGLKRRDTILRNCVTPEIGEAILNKVLELSNKQKQLC